MISEAIEVRPDRSPKGYPAPSKTGNGLASGKSEKSPQRKSRKFVEAVETFMPACDPEAVLERKMTRHLVNPNLRKVGTAGAAVPEGAELWRTYVADMDRQIALMFPDGTASAAPRPSDRPTADVAV